MTRHANNKSAGRPHKHSGQMSFRDLYDKWEHWWDIKKRHEFDLWHSRHPCFPAEHRAQFVSSTTYDLEKTCVLVEHYAQQLQNRVDQPKKYPSNLDDERCLQVAKRHKKKKGNYPWNDAQFVTINTKMKNAAALFLCMLFIGLNSLCIDSIIQPSAPYWWCALALTLLGVAGLIVLECYKSQVSRQEGGRSSTTETSSHDMMNSPKATKKEGLCPSAPAWREQPREGSPDGLNHASYTP